MHNIPWSDITIAPYPTELGGPVLYTKEGIPILREPLVHWTQADYEAAQKEFVQFWWSERAIL